MAVSLTRRRVITALAGTEGGPFAAGSLAAANAKALLYNCNLELDVEQFQRKPNRVSIGALPSLPGKRFAKVTFDVEVKGSGVAGSAPSWGRLVKACGFSETINTGTAAVSAVTEAPANTGTGTGDLPVITGTFTGTKSGIYRFTIISIIANTSCVLHSEFFPADGTAITASVVTVNATPVSIGQGLSVNNTPTNTTGWRAGDEFFMTATSSSQVDVTYKPISDSIDCLDLGYYADGRIFRIHSARGNLKGKFEDGQPGMFSFEFMGVYDSVADGSLLSGIAYEDLAPPQFMGVTATLFSATPQHFTNFEFDMGNKVVPRPSALAASGIAAFRISEREATAKIDTEANTIATFNPFSKLLDGTTGNLSLLVGSTSGNKVTITSPRVQIAKHTEGDREGITLDELDLKLGEPEYDAGGDYSEISIVAA